MSSQTVKQQVLQAVEDLPEDTTFEQAMEWISHRTLRMSSSTV